MSNGLTSMKNNVKCEENGAIIDERDCEHVQRTVETHVNDLYILGVNGLDDFLFKCFVLCLCLIFPTFSYISGREDSSAALICFSSGPLFIVIGQLSA